MKLKLSEREFYGMPMKGEKKKKFFEFWQMTVKGDIKFEQINECCCGSHNRETIAQADRFGFPVASHLCKNCGLIYLSPRMTEDSLPKFYDELYWGLVVGKNDSMEEETLTTGGEGFALSVFDFVKDSLKDKSNLKIAEIGIGNGQKLLTLKEEFSKLGKKVEVYGCDFSHDAVLGAKKKGIHAHKGGMDLLEKDAPFDLVIMSHVVEHLNYPVNTLKNVKKLLATDGILYVEVPGVGDLDKKPEYNYDFYLYSVLAHTYCFNLTSLKSTAKMAGFDLVKGTDFVRSVFKISPNAEEKAQFDHSNYKQVVETLNRAEDKRVEGELNLKSKIKRLIQEKTGYEISRH